MVFWATMLHSKAMLKGTTWANEMNFVMNYTPNAGSIARPVDHQTIALPLCYRRHLTH